MTNLLALIQQKRLGICGWLAACALAATTLAAQTPLARIQDGISSAEVAPVKGSRPMVAQPEFDSGRVPANTPMVGMTLVFNRTPMQQSALNALLAAQQDPASPLFHKWLSPEQFGAQFGMAQSDIDQVTGWLQQQGFSIDAVARARNSIRFSGTAGQVEQAFRTEMHYYKVDGKQHISPSTEISLPTAFASTVAGIRNLSDFKPRSMRLPASADLIQKARPAFTSSLSGNVFFAPQDIKTVYDFAPLTSTGIDGTGQSIAIMGQSDVSLSDVENFQKAAGMPVKDPIKVLVPTSGVATIYQGDESESDLDLEWSSAIAPGATIYFVFTGNSTTTSGIFDSIGFTVDEKLANIISVSYGACESLLNNFQTQMEPILQQASAQGQTILSASGDQGSTACFQSPTTTSPSLAVQEALAVNYPASSPYVLGVGGTEISQANSAYYTAGSAYWQSASGTDLISSALKYMPEVAWNDDSSSNGLSATGGGVSTLFSKPNWQVGVPGIPADGKRDVPDISLFSSPNYVAYLYCTSDPSAWYTGSTTSAAQASSCTNGASFRDTVSGGNYLTLAGGTSFATPIFAGMLALIGEARGYTTGQGLVNPTLYSLASNSTTYAAAFHDITSGNNYCLAGSTYCSSTSGSTTHYNTNAGYDPVTGLGSVDLGVLAAATTWPAATTSLMGTTTTVSASSSSINVNVPVTFTVTVSLVGGSTVSSGTVNVSIDGGGTTYSSGGSTQTLTLSSNGTATFTTTFTTGGAHSVVAQYTGNGIFAASTGATSVQVQAPGFTLSANPTTMNVNQGSSGTSTLTLTSTLGYSGTVKFSLSTSSTSLQTYGCYTLSNTAVPANGTATATLTLYTSQSACSSATTASQPGTRHLFVKSSSGGTPAAPANTPARKAVPIGAAALGGFLLLGLRKRRAKWLTMMGCVLLLGVASMAVGCGGGSSTSGGGGGGGVVAKGSYPLTVIGTDSSNSAVTDSVQLTLNVN